MPRAKQIIHKTYELDDDGNLTTKPLKTYYTKNPIPEGTTIAVRYNGLIVKMRIDNHWVSSETHSTVELVGVEECTNPGKNPGHP